MEGAGLAIGYEAVVFAICAHIYLSRGFWLCLYVSFVTVCLRHEFIGLQNS